MKRAIVAVLIVLGTAWAAPLPITVTVGASVQGPEFSVGPAIRVTYDYPKTDVSLYVRFLAPESFTGSFGVGFEYYPMNKAWGSSTLGARAFMGVDGAYWLEGKTRVTLGKGSLDFLLGYSKGRTPHGFWPFERDSIGAYADIKAKYRLSRKRILSGMLLYQNQASSLEVALTWVERPQKFSLGGGVLTSPFGVYAVLGYQTEMGRAAYGGELRLGAKNELALKYAEKKLKAHLTLAYPLEVRAGVSLQPWALDVAARPSGYELYVRYSALRY